MSLICSQLIGKFGSETSNSVQANWLDLDEFDSESIAFIKYPELSLVCETWPCCLPKSQISEIVITQVGVCSTDHRDQAKDKTAFPLGDPVTYF